MRWYCSWGTGGGQYLQCFCSKSKIFGYDDCMRNIFLQAQHLPGAVNTIATVNQGSGQTNQKELSLRFFQLINAQLSPLLVDLQDGAYQILCTVGFMQYNIKWLPTRMMTHGTSKQIFTWWSCKSVSTYLIAIYSLPQQQCMYVHGVLYDIGDTTYLEAVIEEITVDSITINVLNFVTVKKINRNNWLTVKHPLSWRSHVCGSNLQKYIFKRTMRAG